MGLLVNGQWQDTWYDTDSTDGHFVRSQAKFRNWITPDGAPGPTGEGGFTAEPNRYHLYVSLACPWANRTLIMRALKSLEDMISISVVHPYMGDNGWHFEEDDGVIADPVANAKFMHEVYTRAAPDYTGRVTVPLLWDLKRNTVVSNESADIVRMFNSAFDGVGAAAGDYSPPGLREEIDDINAWIYDDVNNGVYRAGFATTQAAYETAVKRVFEALDRLEAHLANRRYLVGDQLTEADIRLFTTLIRFDSVYHGHFKCNLRRLVDYPALWRYTRDLYNHPGVAQTVNFDHIKRHYYTSHPTINPNGIVPAGPSLDLSAPD